jgi:hypothetical protein
MSEAFVTSNILSVYADVQTSVTSKTQPSMVFLRTKLDMTAKIRNCIATRKWKLLQGTDDDSQNAERGYAKGFPYLTCRVSAELRTKIAEVRHHQVLTSYTCESQCSVQG